ncbi:hypothetical protein BH24ACT4_BH24ACT4_18500 [soil metagenome]
MTGSPERRNPRRPRAPRGRLLGQPMPWSGIAAAVVVLLLATELGTRAVEDWLPISQAGDAAEVEIKYEQITALDEAGEPTDVVFFGNSAMDAAIDPAVWMEESRTYPLPYNASLLGQPYDSVRRWEADFVLPHTDPALVVVGITPFDVPQIDILNTSRAVVEKLFDDAMDRLDAGSLARLDERLQDRSAILRHRSSFRSPVQLYRAGRSRLTNADKPKQDSLQPVVLTDGQVVARTEQVWAEELIQPRGGVANYWGLDEPAELGFELASPVQQEIFRSSRTSRTQMAALRDAAQDEGAQVVFVIPPSLPDAYTTFTGSLDATADAIETVRDEATDLGVPVFDFSGARYPDDHFADAVHLNRVGSARFSADLAAALDEA